MGYFQCTGHTICALVQFRWSASTTNIAQHKIIFIDRDNFVITILTFWFFLFLYRDIKPDNLLLDSKVITQICPLFFILYIFLCTLKSLFWLFNHFFCQRGTSSWQILVFALVLRKHTERNSTGKFHQVIWKISVRKHLYLACI